MTNYYTIRSDRDHSRWIPTERLRQLLAEGPGLRNTKAMWFEGDPSERQLLLMLLPYNESGGYAHDGSYLPKVNGIQIVVADGPRENEAIAIASYIAREVGWEWVEDHEDD